MIAYFMLSLALALQDPAALIEKLRDEDISVREGAMAELEKLGAAAEPALKKIAGDRDAHVADCARRLLRIIELDRKLSPALKAALPGVVRRLALSRGDEWTAAYLSIANEPPGGPGLGLTRDELEPLAEEAVRGAVTSRAKRDVLEVAVRWFHRSARPAIIGLLKDPDKEVRYQARRALEKLLGSAAYAIFIAELEADPALLVEALTYGEPTWGPRLKKFIAHPDPEVSAPAIYYLSRNHIREAIPEVRAVLKSGPSKTKRAALDYLETMQSKETIESIGPLLSDADPDLRKEALKSLIVFGVKIDEAAWRRLLGDAEPHVVSDALYMMSATDSRNLRQEVRNLARAEYSTVGWSALRALERWKDPDLVEVIQDSFKVASVQDQEAIVRMLGDCDSARAAAPARAFLEDVRQPSHNRRAALKSLDEMKAAPSMEQLLALARGPDAALAVDAVLLLSRTSPESIRDEVPRLLSISPAEVIRTNDYGFDEDDGSRIHHSSLALLKLADPAALARGLVKVIRDSEKDGTRAARVIEALGLSKAIPELIALLNPDEARVTVPATRALVALKSKEARPDIVKLLRSSDDDIRIAAASALGDLGVEGAVQELRGATRDLNQDVREAAVDTLARHGVKEAIPDLMRLLDDESDVFDRAARGLVELGSREHVPKMLKWVYSGDDDHRSVAKEVLVVIRPPEAVPVIARLLDHRDSDVRRDGIWLAQVLGVKGLSGKILENFVEPESAPRAREALVELDARDLIPDLRAMASGADPVERVNAIDALAAFEDAGSAPLIRGLLEHPDYESRRLAIVAAGRLRDRESVPALLKALQEPIWDLKNYATAALEEIGGSAPAEVLIELIRDPRVSSWHPVWALIVRQRATDVIPELRRILKDPAEYKEGECALTLAGLGSKDAIPDIMKLVEDGKDFHDAPGALAKLGATEALPVLRRVFERRRDFFYERIAQALADLGDLSAVENPRPGDKEEQQGAARILCQRGDRRGIPDLLKAGEDSPWALSRLNAVRNFAGWKAISEKRWSGDLAGTRAYILGRLATLAGLALRWEKGTTFQELAWPTEWSRTDNNWGPSTLLNAITDEITGEGRLYFDWDEPHPPFSFILESDAIRILPHSDALAFWKKWWADEQTKLKK